MAWCDALLRKMLELSASDLHLSSGVQPNFRLNGEMVPAGGEPVVDAQEIVGYLKELTPKRIWMEFQEAWDADFAYELPECGRFRVNLFMDHHGSGAVFRLIPTEIPTAADLGLPPAILKMCDHSKGLILVTGPTGSGKSTTLAAMIDTINRNRAEHIITIEDPIEFVHPNRRCLINQREISRHTVSFKRALRAALREDPDIILVGEMRDLETVAIAIETAETGHLVFGTLHTSTAASTVDRIIDQFPTDRQSQIRMMLSGSLKGVIAQTLCKKIGGGRVAAHEILICNQAVSSLVREGKTHQITSMMQMGGKEGMRLLNDELLEMTEKGLIEADEAYRRCAAKDDMLTKLEAAGRELSREAAAAKAAPQPATAIAPPRKQPQPEPVPVGAGGGGGFADPFEAFRRKRNGT
ncbi:MAG: type IV pilus twitching motility protein PilT [Planctomycetota bacterium]